jgi:hypothetical protein
MINSYKSTIAHKRQLYMYEKNNCFILRDDSFVTNIDIGPNYQASLAIFSKSFCFFGHPFYEHPIHFTLFHQYYVFSKAFLLNNTSYFRSYSFLK